MERPRVASTSDVPRVLAPVARGKRRGTRSVAREPPGGVPERVSHRGAVAGRYGLMYPLFDPSARGT